MVATLRRHLASWEVGVSAVNSASGKLGDARLALKEAHMAREAGMIVVHGILLGQMGKAKAARFFPKKRKLEEAELAEAAASEG